MAGHSPDALPAAVSEQEALADALLNMGSGKESKTFFEQLGREPAPQLLCIRCCCAVLREPSC